MEVKAGIYHTDPAYKEISSFEQKVVNLRQTIHLHTEDQIDEFLDYALTMYLLNNRANTHLSRYANKEFLRLDFPEEWAQLNEVILKKLSPILSTALDFINRGFPYQFIRGYVKEYIVHKNYKVLNHLNLRLYYLACLSGLNRYSALLLETGGMAELAMLKLIANITKEVPEVPILMEDYKSTLINKAAELGSAVELNTESAAILIKVLFDTKMKLMHRGSKKFVQIIALEPRCVADFPQVLKTPEFWLRHHDTVIVLTENEWRYIVSAQLYDSLTWNHQRGVSLNLINNKPKLLSELLKDLRKDPS